MQPSIAVDQLLASLHAVEGHYYTATSYQFYNGHALMANNQTDTPYPDVHKA